MVPPDDRVVRQRYQAAICLAVGAVPAHDEDLAAPDVLEVQRVLGRLLELDRGEPPALAHGTVTPDDRGRLTDLASGQRVKGMRVGHGPIIAGPRGATAYCRCA